MDNKNIFIDDKNYDSEFWVENEGWDAVSEITWEFHSHTLKLLSMPGPALTGNSTSATWLNSYQQLWTVMNSWPAALKLTT